MLVPEFYFGGWGWGKSWKWGCVWGPPGPLVCGWGGAEDADWGVDKKGVSGGSERPRLKALLPLNSGLFGIQLQGQLWEPAALWAAR